MKVQIRRGVFETNSSSVHSISIIDTYNITELPDEFEIKCNGEFGWENDIYSSSEDKAAYLYQAICDYNTYSFVNGKYTQMPIDAQLKLYQTLIDKFISNLEHYGIDVICEYKTAKIYKSKHSDYEWIDFVNENGEDCKDGYLDHGGDAGDFVDYVLESPENTIRFIFDNKSFIVTGNDNDAYNGPEIPSYGPATEFTKGN